MLENLGKGEKVVTNGGLIVVIYKVEENFFTAKINDDVIVKITKDAIARKYEDEA
jgi:preprotein translocase subunit YajC